MSDLALALSVFHFLRPLWLLLIPLALFLWARTRLRHRSKTPDAAMIAPHLRDALMVGKTDTTRIQPIDMVALTLVLLCLAAAGPTWSRQPNPLVAQSAPVAVVLKVTPSMEADDIAPSRLDRGKHKIRDFLALRAGARSGLVAYAGTAHVVVPMTEDASVILPYLEGLSPDIMPRDGADFGAALALASDLIAKESGGAVLLVADALDLADVDVLNQAEMPVAVLSMLPEGTRDRGLDAFNGQIVPVSPDGDDIRRLDRALNAAYRQSLLENSDQPWQDRGPWLAWPAALLLLLWFRRGWTMQWGGALVVALLMLPAPSQADGLADWFWTPDQQGQRAYDRGDLDAASELFADPLWRGWALFRKGRYEEAIEVLNRVDTAQAAMIQGIAHIRSHGYRAGVAAFEEAVARDPDYPGAAENLKLAREIVIYVEDAQEASDTQDQTELTADDVAYDNVDNRGEELISEVPDEMGGAGLMSAEQWMNSVDTDTSEFLKLRFALEASDVGRQAPSDDTESDTAPEGVEATE